MRCLVAIFVLLLPAFGMAEAPQPAWSELQQLLGKSTNSFEVKSFALLNKLNLGYKFDSGSYMPEGCAYSLMFTGFVVDTIVLNTFKGMKEFKTYDRPLPGGLKPEDNRETTTKKLGPPSTPNGTDWHWGKLTIHVMFDEKSGTIAELYVSRTEDSR